MTSNLGNKCKKIRRDILQASYDAGACHISSALSCVEILVALYYDILNDKDVFLFSKASGVATLYSILHDKGIEKRDVAKLLRKFPLPSKEVSGVVWSGGSLGMGLSVSSGIAMNKKENVYCLISDGELNEGNVWESLLFSAHHKLSNLIVICDRNFLQAVGRTEDVLKLEPLVDKLKAFNWSVKRVDGHDIGKIKKSLNGWKSNKPKILICDTTKGKGVSFIEDKMEWHYKNVDENLLSKALKEIDEK